MSENKPVKQFDISNTSIWVIVGLLIIGISIFGAIEILVSKKYNSVIFLVPFASFGLGILKWRYGIFYSEYIAPPKKKTSAKVTGGVIFKEYVEIQDDEDDYFDEEDYFEMPDDVKEKINKAYKDLKAIEFGRRSVAKFYFKVSQEFVEGLEQMAEKIGKPKYMGLDDQTISNSRYRFSEYQYSGDDLGLVEDGDQIKVLIRGCVVGYVPESSLENVRKRLSSGYSAYWLLRGGAFKQGEGGSIAIGKEEYDVSVKLFKAT